jgi:hypothetical protein
MNISSDSFLAVWQPLVPARLRAYSAPRRAGCFWPSRQSFVRARRSSKSTSASARKRRDCSVPDVASVDLAFDLAPKDTHLGIRRLTGCFGCFTLHGYEPPVRRPWRHSLKLAAEGAERDAVHAPRVPLGGSYHRHRPGQRPLHQSEHIHPGLTARRHRQQWDDL